MYVIAKSLSKQMGSAGLDLLLIIKCRPFVISKETKHLKKLTSKL